MRHWIVSGILGFVGVLNVTPAIVFFAPERTIDLYGFPLAGEDISILMRHRAILLGLLGMAMILAAVKREYIVPVVAGALIGKTAFLYLVAAGNNTAEIGSVAVFDAVAVVLLLIALGVHLAGSKSE